MKELAMLICLSALVLLGCHKKEAAVPSPPSESANAAPEAPAPAQTIQPSPSAKPTKPLPPPPAYVTANADNNLRQSVAGEVDLTLTAALRSFAQKKGRLPQSFFEFTAGSLDNLPRPPAGKKWVIDTSDLTVKAVPSK